MRLGVIPLCLLAIFAVVSFPQPHVESLEPMSDGQIMRVENGTHVVVYELSGILIMKSFPVSDIIAKGVEFVTPEDETLNLTSDGTYLTVACSRPYIDGMGCNFAGASLEGIPGYARGLWLDIIVNYTLGVGGNESTLDNCLYDSLGKVILGDVKSSITVGFRKVDDPSNLPWVEWEKDYYEVKAGEALVLNATATSPLVLFRVDFNGDTIPDSDWWWTMSGSYSVTHVYSKDSLVCLKAWDGYQWGQNHSDTDCAYVTVFDTLPRPPGNLRAFLSGKDLENITIDWTLSPDDGIGRMSVARYDIYEGENYSSNASQYQLLASVPNGTSSYIHVRAGEGDPNNHFYIVCAVDSYNNSSCSDRQVGKYTRPLSKGVNIISIPLIQLNQSLQSVLGSVSFNMVWYYESRSGEWKMFTETKPYGGSLKRIFHTMGLWVNVTSDCNLTVAGVVPAQTSIQLHRGWNLVGFPSFTDNYCIADLKLEINASEVEVFDGQSPPHFLGIPNDFDLLTAGYGYWVRVPEDTLWAVSNV